MADTYEDVLTELGFTTVEHPQDEAKQAGGPHVVHTAHTKGDVTVVCEQNTYPDSEGSETLVTYPKTLVASSPKGAATVRPVDTDALRDVIAQLS